MFGDEKVKTTSVVVFIGYNVYILAILANTLMRMIFLCVSTTSKGLGKRNFSQICSIFIAVSLIEMATHWSATCRSIVSVAVPAKSVSRAVSKCKNHSIARTELRLGNCFRRCNHAELIILKRQDQAVGKYRRESFRTGLTSS